MCFRLAKKEEKIKKSHFLREALPGYSCWRSPWHFAWFSFLFFFFFFFFFFFKIFLELHLQHMEVPRLGVESELQLLAYATATATWDPRHICDLHHSSWQCQILNPLSEARDWTCILVDTSQICLHWATTGIPPVLFSSWHFSLPDVFLLINMVIDWISSTWTWDIWEQGSPHPGHAPRNSAWPVKSIHK